MLNFKNCLLGIDKEQKSFNFVKEELMKKYSLELFFDLISLPCMQFEDESKLLLLIALIEDGENSDNIIEVLCSLLINISEVNWENFRARFENLIKNQCFKISRSQKLRFAHTIETIYAKGYKESFVLANLVYQRISELDNDFNPDSDENVRVKLAKLAYSTTRYNFNEKINEIQSIKQHVTECNRKYLMGAVNYYKGICLKAAGCKIGYNDDTYYILKSRTRGFYLAAIYLAYMKNNFETSIRA